MAQRARDDEVVLRLSGVGVDPTTVQPAAALLLASCFFRAAQAASPSAAIRGVTAREGCLEFAARARDEGETRRIMQALKPYVLGGSKTAKALQKAIKAMPRDVNIEAVCGGESLVLRGNPASGFTTYTTRVRAFVEGSRLPVGTESGMVFLALLEGERVSLRASEAIARQAHDLAMHAEVDADADLQVDEHGRTRGGTISALHVCQPMTMEELSVWGREALAHWKDVPDIDAALNGDGDGDT